MRVLVTIYILSYDHDMHNSTGTKCIFKDSLNITNTFEMLRRHSSKPSKRSRSDHILKMTKKETSSDIIQVEQSIVPRLYMWSE